MRTSYVYSNIIIIIIVIGLKQSILHYTKTSKYKRPFSMDYI